MILTKVSDITGEEHSMEIPMSEGDYYRSLARWRNGELIQIAFPLLNANQREFIMTGITPEEWKEHIDIPEDEE